MSMSIQSLPLQDINLFNPTQNYNMDENEKCSDCCTQYFVNEYQLSHQNIQNMLLLNTQQKQKNREHSNMNGATTTTETTTKTRTKTTPTNLFFSFKVTNLVLSVGELSQLQLVPQMLQIHI